MLGLDRLLRLIDKEFHPVEFLQQVVRKLDIRLVDLVDQKNRAFFGGEGFPHLAGADVIGNIMHLVVAEL